MREILFRGKRICENKNWVEGCLLNLDYDSGHVFIVPFFHGASTLPICRLVEYTSAYVNPETVGQFTGLTDNNGKKIFEGDIVDINIGYLKRRGFVFYEDTAAKFGVMLGTEKNFSFLGRQMVKMYDVKVIGNIHDNLELLEV